MKLDTFDIVIVCIGLAIAIGYALILTWQFFKRPREEQLAQVREWLLWAVTEAERLLGSGTGQLKLRFVYDQFVERFPWLARLISFEKFSDMVDEVLVGMRDMIQSNVAVKAFVEGKSDGN